MFTKFKKIATLISISLAIMLFGNSTLVFANAKSPNSLQLMSAQGMAIIIDNQECNVKIIFEDTHTRIVKSKDKVETTLVILDKKSNQSEMRIIANTEKQSQVSDQDMVKFCKTTQLKSKKVAFQTYKFNLNNKNTTNKDMQIQLSNQSINLNFSNFFYGYFGQYSLSNSKSKNIRITGTDVQKDNVLYTEVNNFRQELSSLKKIESDSRFEAAGVVIGVLLAIPDITISKIAAVLVTVGVAITSANLVYNYIAGYNSANGYYNDVISRCDSIGVRYW